MKKMVLTWVCNRSILEATVKAVVVVVLVLWLVEVWRGTGTVSDRGVWLCCRCRCCSISMRVTASARWLPLLLSLSPFGECSCPAKTETIPQNVQYYVFFNCGFMSEKERERERVRWKNHAALRNQRSVYLINARSLMKWYWKWIYDW